MIVTGAGITAPVEVLSKSGTVVTVAALTGGSISTLTATAYTFTYSLDQ